MSGTADKLIRAYNQKNDVDFDAALRELSRPLSRQVEDLASDYHRLLGLASEMLATVKLNHERGYLVATNDEGKLNLVKIVANWSKELATLERD